MKYFVPIVFLLCLSPTISAQQLSEKDSLLHIYFSRPDRDSSFVKTLLTISRIYGQRQQTDSSLFFAKEANEIATGIGFERGIAASLNYMGIAYFYQGDYPTAQRYQHQSLEVAKANLFRTEYTNALNSLALALQYQGNYPAAADAYLQALQREEKYKSYRGQVKILNNLGLLWKELGELDKALESFLKALSICNSQNDKNFEKVKPSLYTNIGAVYSDMKRYGEALKSLMEAVQYEEKLGYPTYVELCNIGYCYLTLGELEKAEGYTKESLLQARKDKANEIVEKTLNNLAEIYIGQNKAGQAIPILQEGLRLSESSNQKENILLFYTTLADAYDQLKEYDLAFDYASHALKLGDSLKNADISEKISELQKSYEINKKESEISSLKSEQEKLALDLKVKNLITTLLTVIIISIVILLAVIVYYYQGKKKLAITLDNQNKEIHRLNQMLEIRALRSQMDPHFVFNALNGLQYFLKTNTTESSAEYVNKLARLLRLTLQNASRDWVKISEEIEILTLYLEVEQYRYPDKFDFEFIVDDSVLREKVPFLVIQPSVENAVLHGLVPRKEGKGKLLIKAERLESTLQITVQDNGVGRTDTKKHADPAYVSMGSGLVRDRLKKLSLQLNMVMDITTEDLKDFNGNSHGTKSILTFELQPNELVLNA